MWNIITFNAAWGKNKKKKKIGPTTYRIKQQINNALDNENACKEMRENWNNNNKIGIRMGNRRNRKMNKSLNWALYRCMCVYVFNRLHTWHFVFGSIYIRNVRDKRISGWTREHTHIRSLACLLSRLFVCLLAYVVCLLFFFYRVAIKTMNDWFNATAHAIKMHFENWKYSCEIQFKRFKLSCKCATTALLCALWCDTPKVIQTTKAHWCAVLCMCLV